MIRNSLLIGLMLLTLPHNVLASALPDFPFIGVQGEAHKEVSPDLATIGFTLVAFSDDSEKALKTIQTRSREVIDLAKEFKLPENGVISLGIENEIKREVNRDHGYNRTNILGYEVSQSFRLEVNDLSKYSAFIDRLITLSNVGRITPTFDVQNKKEIERSLVAEAGKDARQKADDLAHAMGVKIKSVYAINQGRSFDYFFALFGLQEKVRIGGQVLASMSAPVPDRTMNMMVPKSVKISKEINVVYKIK